MGWFLRRGCVSGALYTNCSKYLPNHGSATLLKCHRLCIVAHASAHEPRVELRGPTDDLTRLATCNCRGCSHHGKIMPGLELATLLVRVSNSYSRCSKNRKHQQAFSWAHEAWGDWERWWATNWLLLSCILTVLALVVHHYVARSSSLDQRGRQYPIVIILSQFASAK